MVNSSVPRVPTDALVELAKSRDGLLRWVRLRALRNTLQDDYAHQDQGSLDELDGLLTAALPEAEAHAARLGAFYRTHAEAIDALLGDAVADLEDARMRERLRAAGPGFAAAAEARASSLAEPGRIERAGEPPHLAQDDPAPSANFCAFLAAAQWESDVTCISTGDPLECAYANLVAELSDQYC